MSQEITCELAVDAKCDLGESPIYDDRVDTLYFMDINKNAIHAYSPSRDTHRSFTLQEPVGTIVPTSNPNILLAALRRDLVEVDVEKGVPTGRVVASVPEEHGVESMRFNDGKVSPQGTLLVGRMHNKWRDGERGRLYRLDPGSSQLCEVMTPQEVWLPNGIAWSPAKGVVYYIDSGAETVVEYQADSQGVPVRGGPHDSLQGRVVVSVASGLQTVPDGMTIDSDGNLWVALGESGCVVCYSAETGDELRRVRLPVQRPTACTFGGEGLRHLYVTTRVETGEGVSEQHGGLFKVTIPGVKGAAPAHVYPLSRG